MDVDTIIPETIPITAISDKVMNRHSRAVRMPQKDPETIPEARSQLQRRKTKKSTILNRDIPHQFNLRRTTRKEKIPC